MNAKVAKQARRELRAHLSKLRAGLPPLPECMHGLEIDKRGYPIPAFVATDPETGVRDFRVVDPSFWRRCVTERLCWISGGRIHPGEAFAFVVGPMCLLSGRTAEPPSKIDAAYFAAQACPFLANPLAKRRPCDELVESGKACEMPGEAVLDNPGVTAVVTVRSFGLEPVDGGYLIKMGRAVRVEWFWRGYRLSRDKVADQFGPVMLALDRAGERAIEIEGDSETLRSRVKQVKEMVKRGGYGIEAL